MESNWRVPFFNEDFAYSPNTLKNGTVGITRSGELVSPLW